LNVNTDKPELFLIIAFLLFLGFSYFYIKNKKNPKNGIGSAIRLEITIGRMQRDTYNSVVDIKQPGKSPEKTCFSRLVYQP
jgi:hypothetical protein